MNFLTDTPEQHQEALQIYADLARYAVSLGGTVSAEHGVGKKTMPDGSAGMVPYLELVYGQTGLRAMARVKSVFDPNWILNRGTMMPPEARA